MSDITKDQIEFSFNLQPKFTFKKIKEKKKKKSKT